MVKVLDVIEELKYIGLPIGIFEYDVTSRPLFPFTLWGETISPQPIYKDGGVLELPTASLLPAQVGVTASHKKQGEPKQPKDYRIEYYPFLGPKRTPRIQEPAPLEKSDCLLTWKLKNRIYFDEAHSDKESGYEFYSSFINMQSRSGTNLYYTVKSAEIAVTYLDNIKADECHAIKPAIFEYTIDPPEKDKIGTTSGGGNKANISLTKNSINDLLINGVDNETTFIGGEGFASATSPFADMAFIVGGAANVSLLLIKINDVVVYDARTNFIHDDLLTVGTTFNLWSGGDTQSVPPLMHKLYGNKSPAYRDLTILTIHKFPKGFITSGKFSIKTTVVPYIEEDLIQTDLPTITDKAVVDTVTNSIVIPSASSSGVDVYNYNTFTYDRTIQSQGNLVTQYVLPTGHIALVVGGDTLLVYRDYFFVDQISIPLNGRTITAISSTYVRGKLQVACGFSDKVELYFDGQLESTLPVYGGDPHTIILVDSYYYIFTTNNGYMLSSTSRDLVSFWGISSSKVFYSKSSSTFVVLDIVSQTISALTLVQSAFHRIEWDLFAPGGLPDKFVQLGEAVLHGSVYKYAIGGTIYTVDIRFGQFINRPITITPLPNQAQMHDGRSDKLLLLNNTGGKVITGGGISANLGTSLVQILDYVLPSDIQYQIDVTDIKGLYGYRYASSDDLTRVAQFFNLRFIDNGDVVYVTNKDPVSYSINQAVIAGEGFKHSYDNVHELSSVQLTYADPNTPNNTSSYTYGNGSPDRTYALSLYADRVTIQRLAEDIVYHHQSSTKLFDNVVGPAGLLIAPGDLLAPDQYITKVSNNKKSSGIHGRTYTLQPTNSGDLFTDVQSTPILPAAQGRYEHKSTPMPVIIQKRPVVSSIKPKSQYVYVSSAPLLTQTSTATTYTITSDTLSAFDLPRNTLKFGKLTAMKNANTLHPFTTDYASTFSVTFDVDVPPGTFTNATYDQLLADESLNAIWIGDELIQFMDATVTSVDGQTIKFDSGLFRGRRGTDDKCPSHIIGEQVIAMLPDTVVLSEANPKRDSGEVIDLLLGGNRYIADVYTHEDQYPWPISNSYISTGESTQGSYVFWGNRYRYELPFKDDLSQQVLPSLLYINTYGYAAANTGFTVPIQSVLYVLKGSWDEAKFRAAIIDEVGGYNIYDSTNVNVSPSAYIRRVVNLIADDSNVLYTEGMVLSDKIGALGGIDPDNPLFVVVSTYEDQPKETISRFTFVTINSTKDSVFDGKREI